MWFMVHKIGKMDTGLMFLDMSKTASTTTNQVFWDAIAQSGGHVGGIHQRATFIRDNYPKPFDSYHKFSVIRNPYDRFISAYFWQASTREGENKNVLVPKPKEREVSRRGIEELMNAHLNHAIMPQTRLITDDNGKIIVDQLLRYENIKEEVLQLVKDRKVPFVAISHYDVLRMQFTRGKGAWQKYYDKYPHLWDLVTEIYDGDIKLWKSL